MALMPAKTIGQLCSLRNSGKPKKEKFDEASKVQEIQIEEPKGDELKLINGKIVVDNVIVKRLPTTSTKSHQKKRTHTDRWSKEETDQFYELLGKWGQNYSFIEHEMKQIYKST